MFAFIKTSYLHQKGRQQKFLQIKAVYIKISYLHQKGRQQKFLQKNEPIPKFSTCIKKVGNNKNFC